MIRVIDNVLFFQTMVARINVQCREVVSCAIYTIENDFDVDDDRGDEQQLFKLVPTQRTSFELMDVQWQSTFEQIRSFMTSTDDLQIASIDFFVDSITLRPVLFQFASYPRVSVADRRLSTLIDSETEQPIEFTAFISTIGNGFFAFVSPFSPD
jgi:hypothetical protein